MTNRGCVAGWIVLAILCAGCSHSADQSTSGGSDVQTGSDGKPIRIAYVTNGVAWFWTIGAAGAKAAGRDLGVDVSIHMPAEGIGDQKRIIEDLLVRGVDGIAISPIDPANQNDLINRAAERTNVIAQDADAPESNRLCYIGMDNYLAGRMCGELVEEALPDGGTVMIYIGRLEQDNARRRRQGLIDELLDREPNPNNYDPPGKVLKGEHYTILGTLTDQFDRAKGKANAEDTIAKYPDLGCMVGLFVYNPPLCLEALRQAGKLGQIKVVSFDEAEESLEGIEEGTVYGTIVQNPYMYGYKSVEVLTALAKGDRSVIPENRYIEFPARKIRKANVDEFWADMKSKLGDVK